MLCVTVTAFCLQRFASLIAHLLSVEYNYLFEVVMVLGQVAFQWLVMFKSSWQERFRYLFIVLSISFMGSVLLIPLLIFSTYEAVETKTALAYFFSVVLVMFLTHREWLKRADLPWFLTYTWVLYRIFLLVFITFPRNMA